MPAPIKVIINASAGKDIVLGVLRVIVPKEKNE